jgi:hypothetical protein
MPLDFFLAHVFGDPLGCLRSLDYELVAKNGIQTFVAMIFGYKKNDQYLHHDLPHANSDKPLLLLLV